MDSYIVLPINDRDGGLSVSTIRNAYLAGNRFSVGRFKSHPFNPFRLDAESGAATDMVERKVESAASRNRRKGFVRKSVFCGHLTLRKRKSDALSVTSVYRIVRICGPV